MSGMVERADFVIALVVLSGITEMDNPVRPVDIVEFVTSCLFFDPESEGWFFQLPADTSQGQLDK